jgi:hypothetical protein
MDKGPSANKIIKMYGKLSYLDQYSGSVMICLLLFVILFVSFSYTQIITNIQPIKNDWANQRCSPTVIPFAGLINKPNDMTVVEYTGENFVYCMNNIVNSIAGYAVQPFTDITFAINGIFAALGEAIQFIRNIIANIRTSILKILEKVYAIILQVVIPIQQVVITLNDFMGKIKGILTAGLYTSLGTYYILQSLLAAVAQMLVSILVILFAVVMVCWIFFPFWPMATAGTVLFAIVAVFATLILNFLANDMNMNLNLQTPAGPVQPQSSGCFHPDTHVKLKNGHIVKMSELNLGDYLENGSKVFALMKVDNSNNLHKLYKIVGKGVNNTDIYVTGTHHILYKDEFIKVQDCLIAIAQSDIESNWFACLITDDHKIQIGSQTFWDWEDWLLPKKN